MSEEEGSEKEEKQRLEMICRFKSPDKLLSKIQVKERDAHMSNDLVGELRAAAVRHWFACGRDERAYAVAFQLHQSEASVPDSQTECEQRWGPGFQCCVGRHFGAFFTHERPFFIYFYIDKLAVLLFRAP